VNLFELGNSITVMPRVVDATLSLVDPRQHRNMAEATQKARQQCKRPKIYEQ